MGARKELLSDPLKPGPPPLPTTLLPCPDTPAAMATDATPAIGPDPGATLLVPPPPGTWPAIDDVLGRIFGSLSSLMSLRAG